MRALAGLHSGPQVLKLLTGASCFLQVCDFGLARPSFNDMPTTIFWTDYVATRW